MDAEGEPSKPQEHGAIKKCLSAMLSVRTCLDADFQKHNHKLPDTLLKVYADFVSTMEGDISCMRDLVCPRRDDMSFASSYGRDYADTSLLNQTLEEVPEPDDMFDLANPPPSGPVLDFSDPEAANFTEYRRRESDSSIYFSAEDMTDDDSDSEAVLPPKVQTSKESAVLPIGDVVPSLDDTDDSHVSIHSVFDDEPQSPESKENIKPIDRTSLGSDLVEVDDNDRAPSTMKASPVSIGDPNIDDEYIETPPPSPIPEKGPNDTMESLTGALGAMKLNSSLRSNTSFHRSASPGGKENCLSGFIGKRESTSKPMFSRIPQPQPKAKKQPFSVIRD
uniref:Rho-GAP domain-containing protein n=1 Tax=Panagrellus redivivus TaxID=6233 RepID=A0A7E4UQG9_PANRE